MPDSADNSRQPPTASNVHASDKEDAHPPAQQLGAFEIRHEIGRGGMGTVFEAWCPKRQSKVAVKVLSQHIGTSEKAVVRFQRESKAAGGLHHPHITPIYSQGEQHGVYFYAMELLEGPSLHDTISDTINDHSAQPTITDPTETIVLERNAVRVRSSDEPKLARTTTSQPDFGTDEYFRYVAKHIATVADALDYAHRHGVIHRDIKPHNLMFGSDQRLLITDFGLARISEEPGVTVTGEIIGSPLYMSPEQVTTKPDELDHRTDIYSLGATMYEWLSLKPPYPGETRERVITMIMNSEPMLLRMHRPNIPVDLETICLQAIARDRNKRYRHASEMRDDLLRYLDNRPIKARRANLGERLIKFWQRHQLAVISCAAVFVALISTVVIWQMRSQVKTGVHAVQQAHAEADEAQKGEETALSVLNSLLSNLPAEIRYPAAVVEAAVEGVQGIVEETEPESGIEAAQEVTLAGIARRIVRDFYDDTSLEAFAGDTNEDKLLRSAHELRISNPLESLRIINEMLSKNKDRMDALMLRCVVYAELGQYHVMLREALRLTQLLGQDARGQLWGALGHILTNQYDRALNNAHQAEQLGQRPKWSSVITAVAHLGLGHAESSLSSAETALTNAPEFIAGLLVRASAHAAMGDYQLAIDDISRVISAEPDHAGALVARGQYNGGLGDFAASSADFERAMAMVGTSPSIGAQWIISKNAQRQLEAQTAAPEKHSEAETKTDIDAQESSQPLEQIQEWFQQNIWPVRTTDQKNPPFPQSMPK